MSRTIFVSLAVLVAWPCGHVQVQAQEQPQELARKAEAFFVTHCYRCHGQNGAAEGGFSYAIDFKQLIEKQKVRNENSGSRASQCRRLLQRSHGCTRQRSSLLFPLRISRLLCLHYARPLIFWLSAIRVEN